MITLITGTPGAGKTLYALRFLLEFFYQYSFYERFLIFFGLLKKSNHVLSTRYVYAHGITGLSLDHEIIVCESQTCDFCTMLPVLPNGEKYKKVKEWNNYAEHGSVFFIDECQHVYRNKGSMSVSEFETHRHKGIDFFMVTQHPMLINTDLRRLVGRHIHLIADFLGRHQYESLPLS
jgi:zona occludens toxin